MDDQWERAIAAALGGPTESRSVRTLTLDSAVKCMHGQLPPPPILERFVYLQHLSLANIGAASLEFFPRLCNLQRLILSDNRIAGGLEYLVLAKLDSLRDLDLSNNRIQSTNDLNPLSRLKLVSLDLYECPVTRENGYRSSVFGSIKSLKYLDKGDVEGNERPDSDEEEDDDDEDDEYDPGSGEVDGEDRPHINGSGVASEGVLDADEDEESEADEEVDLSRMANGLHEPINGGRAGVVVGREQEYDEGEDDESVDEIDEDDEDEAIRSANQDDSDDEEAVDEDDDEDDEEDEADDDGEDEEEEVDNQLQNPERIIGSRVSIDVVDGAEEVDLDCADFEDEEDEEGSEAYLVRRVVSHCNGIEEVDSGEEEVEDVGGVRVESRRKRRKVEQEDEEEEEEEEESEEDDE